MHGNASEKVQTASKKSLNLIDSQPEIEAVSVERRWSSNKVEHVKFKDSVHDCSVVRWIQPLRHAKENRQMKVQKKRMARRESLKQEKLFPFLVSLWATTWERHNQPILSHFYHWTENCKPIAAYNIF